MKWAWVLLLLGACAQLEPQRPLPVPEIQYRSYPVPTPVPCFTEAERPILPPPTPIDIPNATVDQLAAALTADMIAEELYAKQVDALFIRCTKGATS